jgi:hypothetical protein
LNELWNTLSPPKETIEEKPSKSLLEGLWDSLKGVGSPAPQKPPVEAPRAPAGQVMPLPNDPDGFWTGLKQKWHTEAPQRQAEITRIKQTELGEGLNEAVLNLEKVLSKKGMDGTVRRILRTEYRDLTGREYNARGKEIK